MFCKIFTATKAFLDVVTCKVKHLQNICKNVLELQEVDGSKTFLYRPTDTLQLPHWPL